MTTGAKNGNDAAKGRKGKAKSPWARGPMCETARAKKSHLRYMKLAKRLRTTGE